MKSSSSTATASFFNLYITGQIESVTFPLGPEATEIFCRYEAIAGKDWELISGLRNGITQSASNRKSDFNQPIAFNMPIELTYQSTNPFGWPQILMCVYGTTHCGLETSLGYCRVHVPVFGGNNCNRVSQMLKAPILRARCSNMMSDFIRWLTGRNPELKDPRVLLDNMKTKGLSTESYGEMQLQLNVISRGVAHLGFEY
uniref:B9 domain-containing protein 1 n=1 Tax=Glossina brevipalpis TaxID=37001 RepID=A0A1A9WHQ3_9MUSC